MPTGTVKWFSYPRGFGFIQPDDGSKDVFVHINEVQRSGLDKLNESQKVHYEVEGDHRGRMTAVNIQARRN
jgi:cold shock protein